MNNIQRYSVLAIALLLTACGGESVIGTGDEGNSAAGVSSDFNPLGPPNICWEETDGRNCPAFGIKGPTGCEPTLGVCTLDCSTDSDCPFIDKEQRFRSVCRTPVPGDSPALCVLPCDPSSCPEGMVCGQVPDGISMCFFERNCALPPHCASDASPQ